MAPAAVRCKRMLSSKQHLAFRPRPEWFMFVGRTAQRVCGDRAAVGPRFVAKSCDNRVLLAAQDREHVFSSDPTVAKAIGTCRCFTQYSTRRLADRQGKLRSDLTLNPPNSQACQHVIRSETGQQLAPHHLWYGLKETRKHVFRFDRAVAAMYCDRLSEHKSVS